jgi:hypothetical protein
MNNQTFGDKRLHQPCQQTPLAARLFTLGQSRPAPCLVQKISTTGARLELTEGWTIPQTFWLKLDNHPHVYYCHLRWVAGRQVDVEFGPASQSSWWSSKSAKWVERLGKVTLTTFLLYAFYVELLFCVLVSFEPFWGGAFLLIASIGGLLLINESGRHEDEHSAKAVETG